MNLITNLFLPLFLALFLATSISANQENTVQVCEGEMLDIRCLAGETLFITSAYYGRMNAGKCIKTNLETLGCSADVREVVEGLCTSHACSFSIPFPALKADVCLPYVEAYLEVTYTCLHIVERPPGFSAGATANSLHGVLLLASAILLVA